MFEKKKQRIILLSIINPFFVTAVNCARMPVEGSRFDLPYYFTKTNFIGHFSYKLESYIILYKFTNSVVSLSFRTKKISKAYLYNYTL